MCSTLAQVFFPKDNGKQSELSPNCWKHKKCVYYIFINILVSIKNLCKQYRLSLKIVRALEIFLKHPVQTLGICT